VALYIVATPIGNMEDITLRALRLLRDVSLILAEDTRHTRQLLSRHGIETPVSSFHDHNERQKVDEVVRRLREGEEMALVTDAGTPLISDPGFVLVRAAAEAGVAVVPVPGASAVLAFLSAESARQAPGARVVAGRELTKQYEEFIRGTAAEVAAHLALSEPRGEFVLGISPPPPAGPPPDAEVDGWIDALAEEGLRTKAIAKLLSKRLGLKSTEVYDRARARLKSSE
jgi:16S rRNA (cytidine1402-2'-O)-methyltransferase